VALVTVWLECSGWKCHYDVLVLWLLLRQDVTDEGRRACWCGAAVAR
jgi:hypothetical protein